MVAPICHERPIPLTHADQPHGSVLLSPCLVGKAPDVGCGKAFDASSLQGLHELVEVLTLSRRERVNSGRNSIVEADGSAHCGFAV